MKKHFLCYVFITAGLLFFPSCTEDLELAPDSIISVNSFWKTADDARGGLFGMYNQFRELSERDLYYFGESRSEMMGFGLQNADFRIKYFQNTLSENNADRDWLIPYRIINYANLVIKFVPDIPFANEAEKNDIIAQAYTMRAYVYFILAKTWGNVPLVSEPVEGFDAEKTFVAQSSVPDVFQFIKSDLDQAGSLFSSDGFANGRSVWSKPALNALIGEVYLWTGKRMGGGETDINRALQAIEQVENADVGLIDNYAEIFSNKGNREIIFSVHYSHPEASNNYFADMYMVPGDITSSIPEDIRAKLDGGGGLNWWAPSELVRNQFTNDDVRRDASFLEVVSVDGTDTTFLTSVVMKGRGFLDAGTRRFVDDLIIFRYADLLLMKAEAKNALGMDPAVEINQVRQRAYGDNFSNHQFVSGSREENDEAILQERLFELAFEGKRWWDLIRFGKAFEKVPSLQDRAGQEELLLWPITLETLSLNSKIQQNPGY